MTEHPNGKVRSIDFLTPEQLQRKREVDRKSQRQARERNRAYISELEAKVREFETRIHGLEQEFTAFVSRCQCKGGSNKMSLVTTPEDTQWETTVQDLLAASEVEVQTVGAREGWGDRGCGVDAAQWDSFANGLGMLMNEGVWKIDVADHRTDLTIWQRIFDNTMLATSQGFPLASWFSESQPVTPMPSITFDQTPAWQYLPKHTGSTCSVDSVVLDLVQIAQASRNEGLIDQDSNTRPAFPSIQSLLNPTYNAIKARVSRNIVDSIVRVVTTPTLPERIGFLYLIYAIVRWQMNPSQATYYSLPEWLRPLPAQLFAAHPPWVDFFIWPKGREKLCLEPKYHHKHPDIVRICNRAISVNWPYRPSDMLLQVGDDTILNPVFERHIRDLRNWTITEEIFEE
jgi:hypothetical protein